MQIVTVSTKEKGIEKAKDIFYRNIDRKTVLFLSGGKSPKPLYEAFVSEGKLSPAAVALVDERYGEPYHVRSNEKMIEDSGLLTYFQKKNIPWHPILKNGLSREEIAEKYDETVRSLFFQIPKSSAIMSIGVDGHTAGIAPNLPSFPREGLVREYSDVSGQFGERITLTFQALEMIDFFLLWVFGNEKKDALGKMFEKGSEDQIPARFYLREGIEKKVILVTDQKI